MIYTITTNPSLDYYLNFEKNVITGDHNRSTNEFYDAGGKGVNVSIFLNNLSIQSACLGFLGGFTKDYYLDHLKKYPCIQPLFTNIADNTRVNVKACGNDQLTSLNALGPRISDEEYNKFITRASRIYDDDYIVLSGSIQNELHDKLVNLVGDLSKVGTKIILDSDGELVDRCLSLKPFVVKINDQNSGTDEDEIIAKAKDFILKGAVNVIYSSPINNNYYLINEDGTYKVVRNVDLSSSTGSGDAMIAGFLFPCLRGANALEAFKYACSCSINMSLNKGMIDRKVIEDTVDSLEIVSL